MRFFVFSFFSCFLWITNNFTMVFDNFGDDIGDDMWRFPEIVLLLLHWWFEQHLCVKNYSWNQTKKNLNTFYKIGVVLLWSQLTVTSLTGYLEADCEKYLALREPNNDFLTINNKYGLKVMHKYTVLVSCILILCHTIHFDTLHIF